MRIPVFSTDSSTKEERATKSLAFYSMVSRKRKYRKLRKLLQTTFEVIFQPQGGFVHPCLLIFMIEKYPMKIINCWKKSFQRKKLNGQLTRVIAQKAWDLMALILAS